MADWYQDAMRYVVPPVDGAANHVPLYNCY